MKKSEKQQLALKLAKALDEYEATECPLPGIASVDERESFILQLIDSIRRVEYVRHISQQTHSVAVTLPKSEMFDPQKAAAYFRGIGDFDEACWLAFLSVTFGRHNPQGWLLAGEVYGGLTGSPCWTWQRASTNPADFELWHRAEYSKLKGSFGNHRKYASKDPYKGGSFGTTMTSYVHWVTSRGGHKSLFDAAIESSGDKENAFAALYKEMRVVKGFGRLAYFDYLTLLGKLDLASIEPDSAYIKGSTGPLAGTRLLVCGSKAAALSSGQADASMKKLGGALGLNTMVMQVMEDAICNWQKSPAKYLRFRG